MKEDPKGEALRWIKQAEEELKDAEFLAQNKRFYLALYLCQQAAEKALKSFLYYKELEPVFTHSVSTLLDMAADIDEEFRTMDDARRLDDYYISTRYPNGLIGDVPAEHFKDPDEARRFISKCRKIIDMVGSKIV